MKVSESSELGVVVVRMTATEAMRIVLDRLVEEEGVPAGDGTLAYSIHRDTQDVTLYVNVRESE